MTYQSLREKYQNFYYTGYNAEINEGKLHITYNFEIEGLAAFSPEWIFPAPCADINDPVLSALIFSLGMTELISYWKIACPPNVFIKCGALDDFQTAWWKKQYWSGLGEFFYVNGITGADADNFMTIIPESTNNGIINNANNSNKELSGVLIPIGGGKDSAVTIELLRGCARRACYIINPRGATLATADVGGFEGEIRLTAKRTLDKNMLDLNKTGDFLNGHTPFSAIVAFSSLICAYLNGYKYIALSNEASANENTVDDTSLGGGVNHQYSKSFEFEKDFSEYEQKYINSGVHYFSLLRVWSEYQIAGYFSRLKQYHGIFRSCNAGSKQDIWCCGCPKCLFVCLILSPFLSPSELENIFGENLIDKISLLDDFKKLIGAAAEKPFECVGSRGEVNTAVCEAIKKYGNKKLPALFEYYINSPLYKQYSANENPYKNYFNSENLVPEEFKRLMQEAEK